GNWQGNAPLLPIHLPPLQQKPHPDPVQRARSQGLGEGLDEVLFLLYQCLLLTYALVCCRLRH
uniref:Uncharacterized protein n=1 Tax=Aegilops tauschii subsp. strangulata TaxID=200361 RepID=A0A453N682_AEGTS